MSYSRLRPFSLKCQTDLRTSGEVEEGNLISSTESTLNKFCLKISKNKQKKICWYKKNVRTLGIPNLISRLISTGVTPLAA